MTLLRVETGRRCELLLLLFVQDYARSLNSSRQCSRKTKERETAHFRHGEVNQSFDALQRVSSDGL